MSGFKRQVIKVFPTLFKRGYTQSTTTTTTTTTAAASEPLVLIENKSSISKIILNRPAAYNAVNKEVIDLFAPAIEKAENDPNIQAILLKGNGKAFCSGGDVKFLLDSLEYRHEENMSLRGHVDRAYGQTYRNATLKTPLIPILDGITMGFAGGLVMYAPFRIITEKTKYAMPETGVGIFCDAMCAYYLSRLDGHLGKYLTMTGQILNGEDVLLAGLGTHFVPSSRISQLEEHMSQESSLDLDKINHIIHEYSVDESHQPEHFTLNKENRTIIDRCFQYKTAEEIMDVLKNDGTEFASNAAKVILKRSPTCTKINVENFNRIPNMSFIDLAKTEYMLWSTITGLPDFRQGIYNRMVLKKDPEWDPSSLEDVSVDYLRQHVYCDGVELTVPFPHDVDFKPDDTYLRYVLPTRKAILEAQQQHHLNTVEETVAWFQRQYKHKFGVRQKIESLL